MTEGSARKLSHVKLGMHKLVPPCYENNTIVLLTALYHAQSYYNMSSLADEHVYMILTVQ